MNQSPSEPPHPAQSEHLKIHDNRLLRHGFWEIAAATIEEKLRLYGSKTRCFCPRKNGAWPHFFLRLRSHSLRHAREEKKGTGYFFSKKEKVSTHGQNNRKSSLSPFSPSMSEQRELRSRREERMENGVKNMKGAGLFPKTFSNNGNGDSFHLI